VEPDLTSYELIGHLSNKDSQTGDVVGLLESIQEPATPKDVAKQHSVDRRAVHEVVEPLEPWGVERVSDNAHRQITTAGEAARRALATALETVESDGLKWLARSENRKQILDYLHDEGPASAQEISSREGLPSKRTIRRDFDEFEERGWANCEEQNGSRTVVASLNMDGERTASTYDDLVVRMTQVINKAPCLRDLGLECADIPLKALAHAELEEATPRNPFDIEKRVRKLSNRDFQHFRGLQSHWNGENAKAYLTAVKEGKEFEVISRPLGLKELPTSPDEVKCVIDGLMAENYQWLMHTDDLPCSLLILDRNQMMVGPRDPSTANDTRTGGIFSQNDDLIKWAINMYESHHQQSKDPFEISTGFSIGVDDLIELLRSRYLTEDDEASLGT
jgi:predicted transcriptional regulator